jgi:hypothetical protein
MKENSNTKGNIERKRKERKLTNQRQTQKQTNSVAATCCQNKVSFSPLFGSLSRLLLLFSVSAGKNGNFYATVFI